MKLNLKRSTAASSLFRRCCLLILVSHTLAHTFWHSVRYTSSDIKHSFIPPCVWRRLSRSGSQRRQGRQTHPHTVSDSWLFLHPLTFKERVESFDLLWSRVGPVFCLRLSWALSLGTTMHTHTHTYTHTKAFTFRTMCTKGWKKVLSIHWPLIPCDIKCFPPAPPTRWKGVCFLQCCSCCLHWIISYTNMLNA